MINRSTLLFLVLILPSALAQTNEKLGLIIERSDNYGDFWEPTDSNPYGKVKDLSRFRITATWRTPSSIVAVGHNGAALLSKDGMNWTRQKTGTWSSLLSLWGDGDLLVAVGAAGTIITSSDAGETWSTKESNTNDDLYSVWGRSSKELYIASSDGDILRSLDRGEAWSSLDPITELSQAHQLRSVWGSSSQNVFSVGEDGLILRSVDSGQSWQIQDSNTQKHLNAVWGTSENDLYAVGANGLILHSTDQSTWHPEESNTSSNLVSIWGTKEDIFILGESTLLHKVDGRWEPLTLPKLQREKSTGWSLVRWIFHRGDKEYESIDVTFRDIWGSSRNDIYLVGKEGAIFHSTDGARTWTQQESNTTATIRSIWGASEKKLFAVGKKIRLQSSDGGATWEVSEDDDSLHVVSGIGGAVYIAGNTGKLSRLSSPDASTWATTNQRHGRIFDLWGDSQRLFAVGDGMILCSSDGAQWEPATTKEPLNALWGTRDDIFAIGQYGALLHSQDGVAWEQKKLRIGFALNSIWGDGAGKIFITSELGDVLYSSDNGETWTERGSVPNPVRIWGRSADELYLLQGESLHTSTDQGSTWAQLSIPEELYFTGLHGDGSALYLFGEGAFLTSKDKGKTWRGPKRGSDDVEDELTFISPKSVWRSPKNELYFLTWEGGLYLTKNMGKSAQKLATLEPHHTTIWGTAANNLYLLGDDGLYRSTNGGSKWKRVETNTETELRGIWGDAAKNLFVIGDEGLLLRSTDGKTWKKIELGMSNRLNAIWGNDSGIFIAADGALLRSTDGTQWEKVLSNEEESFTDIHGVGATIYAAAEESVARSTDGGSTWTTTQAPNDEVWFLRSIWVTPSGKACALGESLFCTKDGTRWKKRQQEGEELVGRVALWSVGETLYMLSYWIDTTQLEGD